MGEQRGTVPDPDGTQDLAEFVGLLGELRAWAGMPSYRVLAKRVGALIRPPRAVPPSTLVNAFKTGRRRLDLDLLIAIVRALGLDEAEVAQWRQAYLRIQMEAMAGGPAGVFRQLPGDLLLFTGREEELRALFAAVGEGSGSARTVVVSAIEGMAGIGKTRLAVRAAHELVRAGRFSDVQLFVNLRGFDPDHPPADPAAVLDAFLRQLGVPAQAIPDSLDDRSAMFRNRVHGMDALIVLDNAADEDQVRDLIPASPSCLVLITSRRSLTGLADAVVCQLGVFREDEALDLLARIVGKARTMAEPQAAAAVVRLCGYLPLAVALAGGQLRRRSTWRLADLVDRLASAGLDAVESTGAGGASRQGVRTLFSLSVRVLPQAAQRVFCWAALFPGSSFTAAAMAAAADLAPEEAETILERLVDEYLLEHNGAGRYELHDLLRLFAMEFTEAIDGGPSGDSKRAAEHRLGTYYLAATAAAMDVLFPDAKHRRIEMAQTVTPAPAFIGTAEAHSWLDAEHRNIIGLAVVGIADPVPMSILLWEYLKNTSRLADSVKLNEAALETLPADDAQRRAQILNQLGIARECLGHYTDSLNHLERAAEIYSEIGDHRGVSVALSNVAVLHCDHGDIAAALKASHQALALTRQLGDGWLEGIVLGNTGGILIQLGRHAEAIDVLEEAVTIAQENGNSSGHASALGHLGQAHLYRGDFTRALTVLTEALELCRTHKKRNNEGENLVLIGRAYAQSGNPERGLATIQQGLEIAKDNGPHYEAAALTALGDTYRQVGDTERAGDHYRNALAILDRFRIRHDSPLRKDLEAGMSALPTTP
ncbi:ATP-binding protein [Streptacidiphilus carbonis]|uniref:ATP-binding protein n=1 Tax=Streptacidiphilus carbonis TaxID=105422 RepID=UPI00126A0692|nr:helix-turn-helix domain-containing protein [Streptacidiphilus carbonis]